MRTVLFVLSRPVPVREFVTAANTLAELTELRPVLLPIGSEIRKAVMRQEIHPSVSIEDAGQDPEEMPVLSGVSSSRRGFLRIIGKLVPGSVRQFLFAWATIRRSLKFARRVVADLDPAVVVIPDDRFVGQDLSFLKAAREGERRTLLLPFAGATLADTIKWRVDTKMPVAVAKGLKTPLRSILASRWPQHVEAFGSTRVLFYPSGMMVALIVLGVLPPDPWIVGSGATDKVASIDSADADLARQRGVSQEVIEVVGRPSLDRMFKDAGSPQAINSIRRRLQVEDATSLVCCSIPNLWEHGMISAEQHWDEIAWLFAFLGSLDAQVVLSLHPKSKIDDYASVAKQHDLHIAQEPLEEVLPAIDLLMATFSNTVQWAALLGKPSVVMDHFTFVYERYRDFPGVVITPSREETSRTVTSLLENETQRRQLGEAAARSSERCGMPRDPRARFAELLDRLARA